MIVTCPECGKTLRIDIRDRHYIESVQRIGCDDCLRRRARSFIDAAIQKQQTPAGASTCKIPA